MTTSRRTMIHRGTTHGPTSAGILSNKKEYVNLHRAGRYNALIHPLSSDVKQHPGDMISLTYALEYSEVTIASSSGSISDSLYVEHTKG